MRTQPSIPSASVLQLHEVPAGRRLDFEIPTGLFAYIYRRYPNQAWQCIARNACSPHIDRTPLFSATTPEYVVCFCDTAGTIMAATSITPETATEFEARTSRFS